MRDVPDIRVLDDEAVNIDIGMYLSDVDTLPAALTWNATQAVAFPAGASTLADAVSGMTGTDVYQSVGLMVVPAGPTDCVTEVVGFTVGDATDTGYEGSQLRGVDYLIGSPALLSDFRLTPGVTTADLGAPFTYAVHGDAAGANRSVPSPVTVEGATYGDYAAAGGWVAKLSLVAVEPNGGVGNATKQTSARSIYVRTVTDSGVTPAASVADPWGQVQVSIDANTGALQIDPQGEFTAGAIVVGLKNVKDADDPRWTDCYLGGAVMVTGLVEKFAGTQEGTDGFPQGPLDAVNIQDLPIQGTYYFEGIPEHTVTVPAFPPDLGDGARNPLGTAAGQTPWTVLDPGARWTDTTGANASTPQGTVSIVSGAVALPAELQDARFTTGNLVCMEIVAPTSADGGTPAKGRSSKLELEFLQLQPGKVYDFVMSAYTEVLFEDGSPRDLAIDGLPDGVCNIKLNASSLANFQGPSMVVKGNVPLGFGDKPKETNFPVDGWRRIGMKLRVPDLGWLPTGEGLEPLQEYLYSLQIELQATGPTAAGAWDPWRVKLYVDNFEVYEIPGFLPDLALGNIELCGQSRAYPHVVPATRGNIIGDFESMDQVALAPKEDVITGRPAAYWAVLRNGWDVNLDARAVGFADPEDYAAVNLVTGVNHFTNPYVDSGGHAVRLHPGTVISGGNSGVRLAAALGLDGQQADDMYADFVANNPFPGAATTYPATAAQTITIRSWIQPNPAFASGYSTWPRIFLSVQDTNSLFGGGFSMVNFNLVSHIMQGEPGEWTEMTTETDFPNGIAEHPIPNSSMVSLPEWLSTTVAPPDSWASRLMVLEWECFGRRSFDAALWANIGNGQSTPVTIDAAWQGGAQAGRDLATTAIEDHGGFIYMDDVVMYSSAMESERYYDRNYFEDSSLAGTDMWP